MTNKELAAALRCCRINDCENCPARSTAIRTSAPRCYEVLLIVAADALENSETHVMALQQEIERLRGQLGRQWIPVTEREEYQEGPVHDALMKLKTLMSDKDFDKYVENGIIRVTYDPGRLMIITKSEIYRSMLTGHFFDAICQAFDVGNFRVVSQVNGY